MNNPSRLLLILRFLYERTDTEHDVSSKEIRSMLTEHGLTVLDKRTIEADVDDLIATGFDIRKIHRNGVPTRYGFNDRAFDTIELKVLIDAVAASRFIRTDRAARLIRELASLAIAEDRPGLEAVTGSLDSIKAAVGSSGLYVADDLYRAIVARRKIRYRMVDIGVPDMEPVPHRDGHVYTVSPYAVLWNSDRYYLIAYEAERRQILTPRVDRIRGVETLAEPVDPEPEGFDLGYYYTRSYKMYDGPEADVTLICKNHLIGGLIDRFGRSFTCEPVSDTAFRATVRASLSPTFYGWLFQYAGEMTLAGPPEAVREYNRMRRKAIKGPQEA